MSKTVFLGEGSVGKTSLLDLLAQQSAIAKPTAVIDLNPDQLAALFNGVSSEDFSRMRGLSTGMDEIIEIMESETPAYAGKLGQVIPTSPPHPQSKSWSPAANDPVIGQLEQAGFAHRHDNVWYMQMGGVTAEERGKVCSHEKVGSTVFLINRLDDGAQGEKSNLLIDYAHGEDAVTTPVCFIADTIVVVVKPDDKSRHILQNYLRHVEDINLNSAHDINLVVVGNRLSQDPAERAEDVAYIREIAGDRYVAGFVEDPALVRRRKKEGPAIHDLLPENQAALAVVLDRVEAAQRIPERAHHWLQVIHEANAPWHDAQMKSDGAIARQWEDLAPKRHSFHHHDCGHDHGTNAHGKKSAFSCDAVHVHGPDCRHN